MGFFSDLGSTFQKVVTSPLASILNPALALGGASLAGAYGLGAGGDPNAGLNQQQYDLAMKNIALQKEFAQNGIQWRVADAAAAGLSPLAALGASEPSFSPVSAQVFPADTAPRNIGLQTLANMGQDLLRSKLNASSGADRQLETINLRKAADEADIVHSQAALTRLRLQREQTAPINPAVPDTQTFMNRDGSTYQMPSDAYSQVSRGTLFGPATWYYKNLGRSIGDIWTNLISHRR